MPSLADGLPPDIAKQIHPEWRQNEADYWASRDQLVLKYCNRWIGFANKAVVAEGQSPVQVLHDALESTRYPFLTCVGREGSDTVRNSSPKRGIIQFSLRDTLWLLTVVALAFGFWVERTRYRNMAIATHNLESAFESVAEFAAEEEDWRIVTTEGHLKIYRSEDELTHPSYSSTWTYPIPRPGELSPFAREWSRSALRAEHEALFGPTDP